MKKIGNQPNTEADTYFSKLQKNEIKNRKIKKKIQKIFGKFSGNFRDFFFPLFDCELVSQSYKLLFFFSGAIPQFSLFLNFRYFHEPSF